jgi:hypothetical protein
MKRPNLYIVGIEEGEDIQTKGIETVFNKIRAENFPNLKKSPRYRTLTEHQTLRTKKETPSDLSQSKHSTYRTKKEY